MPDVVSAVALLEEFTDVVAPFADDAAKGVAAKAPVKARRFSVELLDDLLSLIERWQVGVYVDPHRLRVSIIAHRLRSQIPAIAGLPNSAKPS